MSESREAATKPSSVASSPATKREFFHASKYSLIVGVITVIAVSASDGVGSNAWASASRDSAMLVELANHRDVDVGVGDALAELLLAVAVDVLVDVLGEEVGVGAVERRLGDEERLPGCSRVSPFGSSRLNETAFSGSEASEPASMSTSYCARRGTPATIPSISS